MILNSNAQFGTGTSFARAMIYFLKQVYPQIKFTIQCYKKLQNRLLQNTVFSNSLATALYL